MAKAKIVSALTDLLDMSTPARMERAAEQGFDAGRTFYHGTSAEFPAFDDAMRGASTNAGSASRAHWLVSSPETASGYADLSAKRELHQTLSEWQSAMDAGKFDLADELMAKAEKLDASADAGGQQIMPLLKRGNFARVDAQGRTWGDLQDGGLSAIIDKAKSDGFDGVEFNNLRDDAAAFGGGRPASHLAVFDPSNIRSVNAAFDPAKRNSADLLAGAAGAAVLGGAVAPEEAEAGVITKGGKKIIEAWHGSPHRFDQFDISKIGTGEGAQAYGHGLYFADSQDVARSYRESLSEGKRREILANRLTLPDEYKYESELFVNQLDTNKGNIGETLNDLQRYAKSFQQDGDTKTYNRLMDFHNRVKEKYPSGGTLELEDQLGALYRTHIDVDPDTLLDWDKPLSEQSEAVRNALEPIKDDIAAAVGRHDTDWGDAAVSPQVEPSGADIYRYLASGDISPGWGSASGERAAEASARLRDLGVPGIRYKDGVSRGTSGGTYNYAMFDDKPISIQERGSADPRLLASIAGGTALAGAALSPEEADASFGGVMARNADQFMLSVANKMKEAGRPRDEIWQKTGWDLDTVDGKPRFEIDDSGASVREMPLMKNVTDGYGNPVRHSYSGGLEEYLTHPELDYAYTLPGQTIIKEIPGTGGSMRNHGPSELSGGKNVYGMKVGNDGDRLATTLHETQHGIQGEEGFAQGGTTGANAWLSNDIRPALVEEYSNLLDQMQAPLPYDEYLRQAWGGPSSPEAEASYKKYVATMKRPLTPNLERDAQITAGNKVYRRLAGEVEARNVEKRLNMTPQERRQIPPWETADVPESEQIVRMRGDSPEYVSALNEQIRQGNQASIDGMYRSAGVSPVTMAAAMFTERRAAKGSKWRELRQKAAELMNAGDELVRPIMPAVNTALAAMDLPMKGYYGITSALGELAAGGGIDSALQRGATVARQPIEQTADEYGGALADKGYPATGSALNALMQLSGPI